MSVLFFFLFNFPKNCRHATPCPAEFPAVHSHELMVHKPAVAKNQIYQIKESWREGGQPGEIQ